MAKTGADVSGGDPSQALQLLFPDAVGVVGVVEVDVIVCGENKGGDEGEVGEDECDDLVRQGKDVRWFVRIVLRVELHRCVCSIDAS